MSLKDAFTGMKEATQERPSAKKAARPKALAKAKAAESEAELATGKSSNPDFERLTVYVRKSTRKAAYRKWEDEADKDMSELVEHLLTKYLNN